MRSILREMYGEMSAWGKAWLYLGVVTLVAATAMSVAFGMSVSIKHALFLGCLSIIAALAPDAAVDQWKRGSKAASVAIAMVCAPLLAIEFFSHAGYTGGLRGENVSVARIQNTKYDDGREKVEDNKANLKLWKEQLAQLQSEHAWAATVKADALRDELLAAGKSVENEAARGGCKSKCEAKMKEKAAIAIKIGVVEQAADLSRRIEATQRLVDSARETSAETEYKMSSVDFQNQFLSRNVALFANGTLKPSEYLDAAADQTVNLAMAAAGTGLPAFAFFVAGLYRRRQGEDQDHGSGYRLPEAKPRDKHQANTSVPQVHHTREVIKESSPWPAIHAALSRYEPRMT